MKKKLSNSLKKFLVIVLVCMFSFQTIYTPQIYGVETKPGTQTIDNSFVELRVNSDTGRFVINTIDGNPHKKSDDNKKLLFEEDIPETSFTTFRIDGKDYIYGNNYSFLHYTNPFITKPETNGMANKSVWTIDDVEITQTIELINDITNPNAGNVKISYTVVNISEETKEIGSRMLLDTMLGSNDGAALVLGAQDEPIIYESQINSENIPQYIRLYDNTESPNIISYGFLKGWGNNSPDKMIVAHYETLSQSKWECEIDETLKFVDEHNDYGRGDSAYALYFNTQSLEAGEELTFETYYGIGSIDKGLGNAEFGINFLNNNKLTVKSDGTGYVEEEFEIIAEFDNTYDSSIDLTDVKLTLYNDLDIQLTDGESITKTFQSIKKGETAKAIWKVKVKPQNNYSALDYYVSVTTSKNQYDPKSFENILLAPSIKGEKPARSYNSVSPANIFHSGDASIAIKGEGFDFFKGQNLQFALIDINDSFNEVIIPSVNINNKDDNNMDIAIDDEMVRSLGIGSYNIHIRGLEKEEIIPQTIEISDDEQYKTRDYGICIVTKEVQVGTDSDADGFFYDLRLVSDEDKLKEIKAEYDTNNNRIIKNEGNRNEFSALHEIILEIRGSITEQADGTITISGYKECTINNAVKYSGDKVVITESDSQIKIHLDGKHRTMDSTLMWNGDSDIIIEKGNDNEQKDYSLDAKSEEDIHNSLSNSRSELIEDDIEWYYINDQVEDVQENIPIRFVTSDAGMRVIGVGGFFVGVKNAVLKKDGVSLGGLISLKFIPTGGDEKENDSPGPLPGVTANIDGVLFDTEGYYGIDSNIEFIMPANVVGPILGFGGDATLSINTTDREHKEGSIDTTVRVVKNNFQFGTNITLAFTKENKVVLDDLIIKAALGEKGIYINRPTFKLIGFGGGYKDMYGFITNSNTAPPGKIVGIAIFAIIDDDILQSEASVEFSLHGIKAEGDMVLMPIQSELFESVGAEIRWSKPVYIDVYGNLNVLDIIKGQARIYISENYFKGSLNASITAPYWFPIINGYKFAGIDVGISSDAFWGSLYAPLDTELGFKYYWASQSIRDIDFTVKALGHDFVDNGLYNKVVYDKSGNPVLVSFGTNVSKMENSVECYAYDPRKKIDLTYMNPMSVTDEEAIVLLAGLDSIIDNGQSAYNLAEVNSKFHTVTVADEDNVIINVDLDPNKEVLPELHVYDPNNVEYILTEYNPTTGEGNYIIDERDGENTESGLPIKQMNIFIKPSQNAQGDWTITSSEEVTVEALEVEKPARLESIDANSHFDSDSNENIAEINWDAVEDENGKVNIYLIDKDNTENTAGILLAEDINSSLDTYTSVIPKGISGDYYVKVELTEGDYGYDVMQTDETISIIDPVKPDSINKDEIELSTLGNGILGVEFTEVDTTINKNTNAKYYLQVYDENGEIVESAGTQVLEASETGVQSTVFGGNYGTLDASQLDGIEGIEDVNKEAELSTVGLEAGKSYKVGIETVVEEPVEDGSEDDYTYLHKSDTVYSDLIYLPEPNPAEIDIELDNDFVVGERAGVEVKIVNDNNVELNFESNQAVTTRILFDEETWTGPETDIPEYTGKSFTHSTTLEDGLYSLTVESTNEQGDVTTKDFSFYVDTEAPILMIENPNSGQIVTGNEIEIKGKSNPSANITINDKKVLMDSEGNFTSTLSIENKMKMMVSVVATDDAGNSTSYFAEVINGDISPIESVEIGQDIEKINAGDEIQLSLQGTDSEGNIVTLDKDQVEWDIIDGDSIAQITEDGLLIANQEGEIIVKGAYYINGDYSLEDAIIIQVERAKEKPSGSSGSSKDPVSSAIKKAMQQTLMREENLVNLNANIVYNNSETSITEDGLLLIIPKNTTNNSSILLIGELSEEGIKQYIKSEETKRLASSIFDFQLVDDNGDTINNFKKPVSISFNIPKEFSNNKEGLSIYYYNEEFKNWEYLNSRIEGGKIIVDTNHFSKYALFYNEGVGFRDIADRWSEEYIKHLKSLDIVNGVKKEGNMYYEPSRGITRLELAAMVVRSFNLDNVNSELDKTAFVDWNSIPEWGQSYAEIICSNNYVTGKQKEDGLYFAPNELTTRAEVATIIGRILSDRNINSSANENTFIDNKEIPSWADKHIKLINSLGIINGYEDNTFKPNNQITREEFAKIISMILKKKLY